ncbi:MAG: energy transducer TonB [Ignavibacteria bacterium]|nr:energy transducer TonB [Ignavibacteria bacterium]
MNTLQNLTGRIAKLFFAITIAALTIFALNSRAQATDNPDTEKLNINSQIDIQAEFPGGFSALKEYFISEMKYPKIARENDCSGKVYVSFTIKKDGTLDNIKISDKALDTKIPNVNGSNKLTKEEVETALEKEAIRLVKNMPKWKPAKIDGSTVDSEVILPIKFKLL